MNEGPSWSQGDDERVAVERRRCPLAERVAGLHVAEVFFPLEVPVEVVAVDAKRPERHKQVFAVGNWRSGCVGVRPVHSLVWHLFVGCLLPDDLAGVTVETKDGEFILAGRRTAAPKPSTATPTRSALGWLWRIGRTVGADRRISPLDGSGDEDAIAPHNWAAAPLAGNGGFPDDVLGSAPGRRWGAVRGFARAEWPTPLVPVALGANQPLSCDLRGKCDDGTTQGYRAQHGYTPIESGKRRVGTHCSDMPAGRSANRLKAQPRRWC